MFILTISSTIRPCKSPMILLKHDLVVHLTLVSVDQSAAAAAAAATGAPGTGFGKRERQNIDPGKH